MYKTYDIFSDFSNDENSMDGGDWSMDSRGSMDSSLNSYGEGSWNNLSQLPLNYSNISADETTRKGSPDAGCDSSSDNEQASGELDNQPSGYEAKSSTHCDRPLNAENAAAEKMPVDFEIGSKGESQSMYYPFHIVPESNLGEICKYLTSKAETFIEIRTNFVITRNMKLFLITVKHLLFA